ncbi:uncharacterized protein BCR38DRAFT_357079 [Pseudomassariella vexata]|uniref:Uncharacterized protein n=1 Tax=Pseudomassariella vexata TaxID=1141098 RepID=A0A1Y2D7M1_9PEZI|nr:uncharacterized protein BCR38DRAFT_357079 [Pseudomassariella vexata]ORY55269.1 hypothetical protein BCR38DRAFT_357079 [Pseudomassariella vexata]
MANSPFTQDPFCSLLEAGRSKNDSSLGWVPESNYRSTNDIIWTCVLVIFTCVWTTMHINVPSAQETWKHIIRRKPRWAIFNVYAPEAVTLLAACQWQSARRSRNSMRKMGVSHWKTVHGFFADSGGYALASPDAPVFPVNSRAIQYLVSKGYIAAPSTTEAEIWDKSKSDHFAKTFATIQVLYLVSQVIIRTVQGFESSCFEILTLAFCLCALATNLFWLDKPKDVTVPIILEMETPMAQIVEEAGSEAWGQWMDTPMDFFEQPGWTVWNRRDAFRTFGGLDERPLQRIPNDYITPPATLGMAIVTWVITVLHPAIHMMKWNYEFPTLLEQYVWRLSSTALLAILFFWGLVEVMSVKPGFDFTLTLLGIWVSRTKREGSWWRQHALDLPGSLSAILYFLARTALIVGTVSSLRQMPFSVYQEVGVSQYIPHFG